MHKSTGIDLSTILGEQTKILGREKGWYNWSKHRRFSIITLSGCGSSLVN